MQEFIKTAVSEINADEGAVKSTVGGLLGLAKKHMGSGDFGELAQKIPGAETEAEAEQGGGLLGSVGGLLGGGLGGATELLGVFKKSGLDSEQGASLVQKLLTYIKEMAGGDIMDKVKNSIPGLSKLTG